MKNLFPQLTALVAAAIFMSACQGGHSSSSTAAQPSPINPPSPADSNQKTDTPTTVQQPTAAGPVQISFVKDTDVTPRGPSYLAQFNRYTVKIAVPEALGNSVRIFRQLEGKPASQIDGNFESKENYLILTDRLIYQGQNLKPQNYTYYVMSDNETLASAQFEIRADLIVTNNMKASDLQLNPGSSKIGILYFDYKSTLETEGQDYDLSVSELISNDSTLESYSEADAAKSQDEGLAGHNSGSIKITATKASGTLTVLMRGTKGGQGHKGEDRTDVAAMGAKGADEQSYHARVCEPNFKRDVNPKEVISLPPMSCQFPLVCQAGATQGGKGADGERGNKGQSGLPGGDIGTFNLSIQDNDGFYVTVTGIAGEGGDGGQGGKGQLGGPGGPQGTIKECRPRSAGQGPRGTDGANGETGDKGNKGNNGQSCVKPSQTADQTCTTIGA